MHYQGGHQAIQNMLDGQTTCKRYPDAQLQPGAMQQDIDWQRLHLALAQLPHAMTTCTRGKQGRGRQGQRYQLPFLKCIQFSA